MKNTGVKMRKIAIQSVLGALMIGMVTSALAAQGAYAMAVVPVIKV